MRAQENLVFTTYLRVGPGFYERGVKGVKGLATPLTIFLSTVHLREVVFELWTSKWVSVSIYERWPLTGG